MYNYTYNANTQNTPAVYDVPTKYRIVFPLSATFFYF